jgi:hypothetical protein
MCVHSRCDAVWCRDVVVRGAMAAVSECASGGERVCERWRASGRAAVRGWASGDERARTICRDANGRTGRLASRGGWIAVAQLEARGGGGERVAHCRVAAAARNDHQRDGLRQGRRERRRLQNARACKLERAWQRESTPRAGREGHGGREPRLWLLARGREREREGEAEGQMGAAGGGKGGPKGERQTRCMRGPGLRTHRFQVRGSRARRLGSARG